MSQGAGAIDELRREIDTIDTTMHDLLIRRSEIAAEIGRLKSGAPDARGNGLDAALLRPGREAVILRRLVGRHRGPLPWGTIVRIWRELMAAVLRTQGPLAVAVHEPEPSPGTAGGAYWDLARDHFGVHTPMTAHTTGADVLRAVGDGRATVGILPMPQEDERDPWWARLANDGPRIFARLPFGAQAVGRGRAVEALAIGRLALEPTGEDRSLVTLETAAQAKRSALREALEGAKLPVIAAWAGHPASGSDQAMHLVEIDGFVAAEDERWRSVQTRLGPTLRQVRLLGAYAVPLHPAAPADAPLQAAAPIPALQS
jgi:chorismate mutase / prephenate dehydratase